MTRYLTRIKITWEYILNEEALRSCLDAGTVTILEGRCPRFSAEDERLLERKKSDLFPTISAVLVQSILARVQNIDSIIPSIHTFLEDTKLLEPCAKIMKKLLPINCRTSILQEFGQLHNGQTSWSLQISEASYRRKEEDSSDTAHKRAYRQLWLYAIRHFPEMIGQPLRRDPPKTKIPLLGVELVWWYRLTALAEDCGYAGVDKTYHRGEEADYKMAHTFLQQVRPPQLYSTATDTGSSVQQMVDLLGRDHTLLPDDTEAVEPDLVVDMYGVKCGPDITSRCGVPFERAFRQDQKALFLRYVDQRSQQDQQDCVGSFMVKRDTFHNFFGFPEKLEIDDSAPTRTPDVSAAGSEMEPVSQEEDHLTSNSSPAQAGIEHLQRHMNETEDFTSSRPPDKSSAEEEMIIDPQEENHLISDPPPTQVDMDSPASLLHSSNSRTVTRDEALRIFKDKDRLDPERVTIIRQESPDRFTVFNYNRQDRVGISEILPRHGGREYQVLEEGSKRMKMTSAVSIPDENVVLIAESGVRLAFEETFNTESDLDDIS